MKLHLFAFLFLLPLLAVAIPVDRVQNVHVADRSRFVTDQTGTLRPETVAWADSILADIWRQTGAEPVAVFVDSTDGDDIDDYATELFTRWGIGKKDRDNGLLVLVAVGDRRAAIRTGYGTEGVLPDVVCTRIIRHKMIPHFKQGDYDGGLIAALQTIRSAMTSDDARAELASDMANDAGAGGSGAVDMWKFYLDGAMIGGGVLLLLVMFTWLANRRKGTPQLYQSLARWKLPMLMFTALTLGMALPALLVLLWAMHHTRHHKRLCPNCSHKMHCLSEAEEDPYLTPVQEAEENLKSIDYDVWLCDNCGERDIIPYVNPRSTYTVCPNCGARAEQLVADRVIKQPTHLRQGLGEKQYVCRNCGHMRRMPYEIAKLAAAPIIIGGGGFGSGGGGGFSGGSFGGGMTGGGGGSGSW